MTVDGVGRGAAASVLLLLVQLAPSLQAVTIEHLLVPSLVELGSGESFMLECKYRLADTSDIWVEWYFKPANDAGAGAELVYRWLPPQEPQITGVLRDKIAVDPRAAGERLVSRLLVPRPDVRLSGEYTCVVTAAGLSARSTRALLVYSEEHDLRLEAERRESEGVLHVACSVDSVYPEPDLTLERLNASIPKQSQRVMESDSGGGLMDALTTAELSLTQLNNKEHLVCRLTLRHTPYHAVKLLDVIIRNASMPAPGQASQQTATTTVVLFAAIASLLSFVRH